MHLTGTGSRVKGMEVLTSQQIKEEFVADHNELIEEYGDATSIPKEERFFLNERVRARYCVATNPTWTPEQIVSYYSIDRRVAEQLFGVDKETVSKKPRRADKYDAIKKWCEENVYAEVTPHELAEVGELSYQTMLKYIADNPQTFRKVGRGKYEIRDAKADREAEK